jgi:rubrerythrin
LLRMWLLSRIVKSALVFERVAIDRYRGLLERLGDGPARLGLEHLRREEEMHWRILGEAAEGKLDLEQLEKALHEHLYASLEEIRPLDHGTLELWGVELAKALEAEKETFIFYGNLRRMSKIPTVKRAFEVLADMEKEHVEILSKLLGVAGKSGSPSA